MENDILKNFVVFEGIDGAGTSTQIERLRSSTFSNRIFTTAEPTKTETGIFLRRVLSGEIKVDERTAAYLFAADRAEHIWGKHGIEEKCKSGMVCISDRYFFSSLAYQGSQIGEKLPRLLNSPFPLPELLFFFEIDPALSLQRIGERSKREIYEEIEFLKKTAARYKSVVDSFEGSNMKIVRIDATKSIDEVCARIWEELSKMPIFKEESEKSGGIIG